MARYNYKKWKILAVAVGLFVGSYIIIKYMVPLVWPFILAYVLACLIFPIVKFLRDNLHFHKNAATIMVMILVLGGILAALTFFLNRILAQVMVFVKNWPSYEKEILYYLERACDAIGRLLNLNSKEIYAIVYDGFNNTMVKWQGRIMPMLVDNSIHTVMVFIDVMIVIVLTFMAIFYMARDMDELRKINKNNMFYKEIVYFKKLVSKILKAYIKSQLIIIVIIATICGIGLAFVGNNYNILLGIVIGVLDALPLIGVGIVLVPWSIVYIFTGEYMKAGIIFVTFVACYLVRELLEPKLMGRHVGISPMASLISIYVGYKLFGFIGMIAGPLVYVFVREMITAYNSPLQ